MKIQEFQKIGTMLAKQHKIRIEQGNSWSANIKDRVVYYRKEDVYGLSEDHILGFLLHEVAHIHYTTVAPVPEVDPELSHSALNMLEDISIEHRIGKDYPNAEEVINITRGECLDQLVKMLPHMKTTKYEKALLYAAVRFDGRGYQYPLAQYEKTGHEIGELMDAHRQEILNRAKTEDHLPLVAEIIKILKRDFGEPTDEEKQQMNDEDNDSLDAQETSQQGSTKNALIKQMQGGRGWGHADGLDCRVGFIDEIADQASMIGKKLRSILKRNNAMEFAGRYRTGKLLAKRFVRIAASRDRKPFARRIVKSNQSYAFAIATDVSGSMYSGEKANSPISYGMTSMYMVAEALRIAGVPRNLILFGDEAVALSKVADKKQMPWETINNYDTMQKAGGGTEIHVAIAACAKELDKVRAERKIMIILTDGSSDYSEMQRAHKQATLAGIECLAITIGNGGYMDSIFGKDKNITIRNRDPSQIGTAFVNILKASVKASG